MKNNIINQIIADYFLEQDPFKSALDQLVHNNFDTESGFCHHKVRVDFKKFAYKKFDTHLADDIWNKFHQLYHAYDAVYNQLTTMVKEGVLSIDEEGVCFEGEMGFDYIVLRDLVNESMEEVILHIMDDYFYNYEYRMTHMRKEAKAKLEAEENITPVGDC